jgi:hypothetical protein
MNETSLEAWMASLSHDISEIQRDTSEMRGQFRVHAEVSADHRVKVERELASIHSITTALEARVNGLESNIWALLLRKRPILAGLAAGVAALGFVVTLLFPSFASWIASHSFNDKKP